MLVAGIGGAGGSYLLLRTRGSPQQTAAMFLSDWQRGRYPAMSKIILNIGSPSGLASAYQRAARQLGTLRLRLRIGQVSGGSGTAVARFTATDYLASGQVWSYRGRLDLVTAHRRWWVRWSPAAIYPALRAGERFTLTSTWPARRPVLGAGGTVLSSPAVQAQSGSLALLTGLVGPATARQARLLGAPYRSGDPIGQSGIEQAYQRQLAGHPALTIRITGPGRRIDATAARFAAAPGTPVRTSIDLRYQLAASSAVRSATTSKPVDFVAIQPSTGRVLAMVVRPGGWDRAFQGTFPPGSTFKIITASALALRGMTPSSPVRCPARVTIDGYHIHNANYEQLGATDLLHAFAISCNTTFAMLATQRLDGPALAAMARRYGLGSTPAVGIPAFGGQFTTPRSPVDLAADGFGQGKDLVSPLSQAAVVAAVDTGIWRSPELVISPAPRHVPAPHQLSQGILAVLRPMMRAVVTIGTAAGVGFGPGVYGKTGTAEYVTGTGKIAAHSWFIGYRGDLAFAVLVEGGGFGAKAAAPIAKAFLSRVLPGLVLAGGRSWPRGGRDVVAQDLAGDGRVAGSEAPPGLLEVPHEVVERLGLLVLGRGRGRARVAPLGPVLRGEPFGFAPPGAFGRAVTGRVAHDAILARECGHAAHPG